MGDYVFFTKDRMFEMWGWVESLLKLASPAVLIAVAILSVGLLLPIIVNTFKKSEKNQLDGAYDLHDDDEESVRRTR